MTPQETYASLHAVNQAALAMNEHIESLKNGGLVGPEMAQVYKLRIEETRALVSSDVILNMDKIESEGAFTVQQDRLALEQSLKDKQSGG